MYDLSGMGIDLFQIVLHYMCLTQNRTVVKPKYLYICKGMNSFTSMNLHCDREIEFEIRYFSSYHLSILCSDRVI